MNMRNTNNRRVKTEQFIDGEDLVTVTTVRENVQAKKDTLDAQSASALAEKSDLENIDPLPIALTGFSK